MPCIKHLSLSEIHKIAAGQVVERPANIVKELIENSIDASATVISVFIENGGKKLIRVVDNGCGMDSIDAQLCFEKHATSKIESIDQLATISTFGFRGEALASIAAVSKVRLITRHMLEKPGTQVLHINGITTVTECAGNIGTDITIENLFYNMPARLKFLKSDSTEQRHIMQLIHAFCFSHPHIHFKLHTQQQLILNSPSAENITHKAAILLPHNPTLLTFDAARHDNSVIVAGVITNHQYGAYDRSSIFCIVNNRWVKNYTLSSAFIKGCKQVIPQGKFPAGVLLITVDPILVDINTHPRKEEVVFVHPRIVEQLIENTITTVFEEAVSNHIKTSNKQDVTSIVQILNKYTPSFAERAFNQQATPYEKVMSPQSTINFSTTQPTAQNNNDIQESILINTSANIISIDKPLNGVPAFEIVVNPQNDNATSFLSNTNDHPQLIAKQYNITYESRKIVGQLFNTYILLEDTEGLFLVDQHAAHERILYELCATQFKDAPTIGLLFAHIIHLEDSELPFVDQLILLLKNHGIVAELFGHKQLIIQAVPVYLKECALDDVIHATLADLKSEQYTVSFDPLHAIRAQIACKAAIKAGDVLTEATMQKLLDDLSTTDNRFLCPHGRPTGWTITLNEIEKKFKRKK
jgi:DNA mismatch repair protein MutL